MSFKEVKELRKAGNLIDAYKMAQTDLEQNPNDIWNKRSIAWVIYEYVKACALPDQINDFIEHLRELNELELPEDEKMVFDNVGFQIGKFIFALHRENHVEYSKINEIFQLIKNFHFTKPSEAYSFINKAFHKGYKEWDKYIEFMDWWGLENFKPDDFLKEELLNGQSIMSIVEQTYIAYAKKLLEGEIIDPDSPERQINIDKINAFLPKIEAVNNEHPEYQYPAYFHAKLLIALGDQDNVLTVFLPFAKKKRNDFWVWELIADTFPKGNPNKMACLCKALSLRTQEHFLINTRQKLTSVFIDKEMYNEAKTEIQKIIKTRKENSWGIPYQIQDWANAEWYNTAIAESNNRKLYTKHTGIADEILFSDEPEEIIAVEFVNKDKKMITFIKDRTSKGFFKYAKIIDKPKIGDILKVRLKKVSDEGYHKLLTAKKVTDDTICSAIKSFDGEIRIAEKGFGFVHDFFIAAPLIQKNNILNNQSVVGKAILSFNKKKNDWGWKAFDISSIS